MVQTKKNLGRPFFLAEMHSHLSSFVVIEFRGDFLAKKNQRRERYYKMSSSNDGLEGGATIATSSATDSMKDEDVDSTSFEVGEQVLTYHGPCLYDAKVQKVELHVDEWRYYVHYPGWNKKWDEWLSIDRLLKCTEENLQKQKELKEKYSLEKHAKPGRASQEKPKRSIGVKGKRRKYELVEKEYVETVENLVNIQIPSTLKKQLVDDYESITQLGQLVKLPRSPSVYEILNKYFDYRVKKDGMIVDTVAEIVMGLRMYFDKALPAMLLYRNERQQYKAVISDNVSPSAVYGAEHLLRLFVKLPEMLNSIHIEMDTLTQLQQRLVDILRFLQTNQSSIFLSNYEKSDGFATAAIKNDDN